MDEIYLGVMSSKWTSSLILIKLDERLVSERPIPQLRWDLSVVHYIVKASGLVSLVALKSAIIQLCKAEKIHFVKVDAFS